MLKCILKEILYERGLKQKLIIDRIGLHRNTVSDMVNGKPPELENAIKVAKLLGLTVEEIWKLEE